METLDQSAESKTIYGIVDGHVARAETEGSPLTIKDHLIMDGVHDVPLINSLYRQIYAGLKVGGPFHEHLGPVYVLNEHRGGRQPEGFGDHPPFGHDKLRPDPGRALLVRSMFEAATGPFELRSSQAVVTTAARTLATVPSRAKQEKIGAGFVTVDQENAILRERVSHLEETNEFLRRENEALRTGQVSTIALPSPTGRRGRPPVHPPAQAPNGNGPH